MELQSKTKLEETEFFLRELLENSNDPIKTNFFLSAFLTALRSVLDVLLYDYAEEKKIGLTREDNITTNVLKIAAKILKRNDIDDFIKWWNLKTGLMNQKFKIWHMRKIIVHRGYPAISRLKLVYTPFTLSSGTTLTLVTYQPTEYTKNKKVDELQKEMSMKINLKEILEECKKAYKVMEGIEKEAEELFFNES